MHSTRPNSSWYKKGARTPYDEACTKQLNKRFTETSRHKESGFFASSIHFKACLQYPHIVGATPECRRQPLVQRYPIIMEGKYPPTRTWYIQGRVLTQSHALPSPGPFLPENPNDRKTQYYMYNSSTLQFCCGTSGGNRPWYHSIHKNKQGRPSTSFGTNLGGRNAQKMEKNGESSRPSMHPKGSSPPRPHAVKKKVQSAQILTLTLSAAVRSAH